MRPARHLGRGQGLPLLAQEKSLLPAVDAAMGPPMRGVGRESSGAVGGYGIRLAESALKAKLSA